MLKTDRQTDRQKHSIKSTDVDNRSIRIWWLFDIYQNVHWIIEWYEWLRNAMKFLFHFNWKNVFLSKMSQLAIINQKRTKKIKKIQKDENC